MRRTYLRVRARRVRRVGVAASLLLFAGCRCESDPPSSPAAAALGGKPQCVPGGVELTFAAAAAEARAAEPLDPDIEQPFAAEPGMAVALGGDFFATGLRHDPRGGVALLGRLGATGALATELGRVRGDVPPPRLSSDGQDLWVVLQEGAPGGRELRIGRVPGGDLSAPPLWRSGPRQASAESSAFDIAAASGQALLVYDDWSASEQHGRVLAALLSADSRSGEEGGAQVLSPIGMDAEAPRVSARPGGYWVAWLVTSSRGASGRVYDPGGREASKGAGAAFGARWLALVAVDATGQVEGDVRRLTPRQQRVVGYDLTTGPSGAAWVAWRQDAPTPGSSGGRVAVMEARLDGSDEPRLVREEDVGSGEPAWLPGGEGRGDRRWLSFPDGRDRTLLLPIGERLEIGEPLALHPRLERAGALAASGDQILFAVPRGRAVELSAGSCGEPAPSDAGAVELAPEERGGAP